MALTTRSSTIASGKQTNAGRITKKKQSIFSISLFLLFQGCDDHLSCKHHDVFDCWSRYGILILFQDECQATVLSRRLFIELQFAILGTIAHSTNTSIDSVVNSGPGLVFITYPEVVLRLPGAPVWAVLFFIMLAVSLLYHT